MLDQLAGLFFIGLAAFCVWRSPAPVTWGFFLYSIWFNSGQVVTWDANLSAEALRWWRWLQAIFYGVGLIGLVMFALYFPHFSVKGWRRAALWLLLPFVALTGLNLWALRNYTAGAHTEVFYDAYYYLVFATYLAVFALFVRTYATRPKDRPRIRWVILGASSGLLCFILADVITETSLLNNYHWAQTLSQSQWGWQTLDAANALFALAVGYAFLCHRVISIRPIIYRTVVWIFGSVVTHIALGILEFGFHKKVENAPLIDLIGGIAFLFAHEHLHVVMNFISWLFFRKWYIAKCRLERETERLNQATQVGAVDAVDHALIDTPANALSLTAAGLFSRQSDNSYHRTYATASWPRVLLPTIPADHPLIESLKAVSLKPVPLMLPDRHWQNQMLPSYSNQMPVLAVPIMIRRLLSRTALFGPHTNDEAIDRDERNIIGRMAKSASLAYATLEAEEVERAGGSILRGGRGSRN